MGTAGEFCKRAANAANSFLWISACAAYIICWMASAVIPVAMLNVNFNVNFNCFFFLNFNSGNVDSPGMLSDEQR